MSLARRSSAVDGTALDVLSEAMLLPLPSLFRPSSLAPSSSLAGLSRSLRRPLRELFDRLESVRLTRSLRDRAD